ncbi:MAG: leucine-rich repeat protein [Lachnospiraceae bacterium]|nr:leucine-rich repeat protein [Lachnospiraceae bacterium]
MRRFKNVTKCISCMAVALMLCVMSGWFTQEVFAEKCDGEYEDFEYEYDSETGEMCITGYNGDSADVIIPESIEGHTVTMINIYFYNENMRTVYVPAGVSRLGIVNFSKKLENVYVDEANQTYKSVDGVLYTKDGKILVLFPNRPDKKAVISEGTEGIVYTAFKNSSFSEIFIPDSIKYVYKQNGEIDLKDWDILSVENCLPEILSYQAELENVYVGEKNKNIMSIDGMVYSKDMKTFVMCPQTRSGEVVIDNNVEILGRAAFGACTDVNRIVLGDKINEIRDICFMYSGLTELNIPDSCTNIGRDIFFGCQGLTTVNIPAGIKELNYAIFEGSYIRDLILPDDSAFAYENGIIYDRDKTKVMLALGESAEEVVIPEGVIEICEDAFKNQIKMQNVIFPESLEKIGRYAFDCCIGLKNIIIPKNVTEICEGAFGNTKMTDILIEGNTVNGINVSTFEQGTITVLNKQLYEELSRIYAKRDNIKIVMKVTSPSIKLNKTKATIYSGNVNNTVSVKATLENITGKIKWTTSDKSVATVSNGKIKAVGKGTATIKASIGKTTAKVVITVKNPTVTVIEGSKAVNKINVKKAKTVMYKVKVNPAKSKLTIVQDKKSKQMAKVTLKKNILSVKGLKKGSTEIKIKCGAGTKKMKIVVG